MGSVDWCQRAANREFETNRLWQQAADHDTDFVQRIVARGGAKARQHIDGTGVTAVEPKTRLAFLCTLSLIGRPTEGFRPLQLLANACQFA
jgi:hypothetical protein